MMAQNQVTATRPSLGDRLSQVVAQYRESRRRARVFQATYQDLANLSARELADIGITRDEIAGVAAEAARRA